MEKLTKLMEEMLKEKALSSPLIREEGGVLSVTPLGTVQTSASVKYIATSAIC